MIYPKQLKVGDTIGLICPCSGVSPQRAIACKEAVERLGFKVKVADNLTEHYGGYMAGSGEARGKWVNAMFADPEVDGIFCIRGGQSGSRAMEFIDFDVIRANPKVFVGYSDVTSLHCGIANHCNFVTFHGPMVSSNMVPAMLEKAKESLFQAINAESSYQFQNPVGCEIQVLKEGRATGQLTGGNLALLSASIGTPYEVDTKGKILLIEEVHETMGRTDRYGYHLKNAGKLKDCIGVILGQFTDCTNDTCPEYMELELFRDLLQDYDIPVLYNIQCGHENPNMTLPLGAMCTIDSATKSIAFETPQRN